MIPDLANLIPVEQLAGDSRSETSDLRAMVDDAKRYVERFKWCEAVLESYAGITIPGVVAVLLHKIRPTTPEADEWLWTVTGDLPPAYIVVDDAPNAPAALEGYVGEMRGWVEAVKTGQPTEGLIPVNADATEEFASMLESRLAFIEDRIIPEYDGDP